MQMCESLTVECLPQNQQKMVRGFFGVKGVRIQVTHGEDCNLRYLLDFSGGKTHTSGIAIALKPLCHTLYPIHQQISSNLTSLFFLLLLPPTWSRPPVSLTGLHLLAVASWLFTLLLSLLLCNFLSATVASPDLFKWPSAVCLNSNQRDLVGLPSQSAKAEVFTVVCEAAWLCCSWLLPPHSLSSSHADLYSDMQALMSSCWLFLLSGTLFIQIPAWPPPSFPSGLCLNVILNYLWLSLFPYTALFLLFLVLIVCYIMQVLIFLSDPSRI